jgi:hypothetical protein
MAPAQDDKDRLVRQAVLCEAEALRLEVQAGGRHADDDA